MKSLTLIPIFLNSATIAAELPLDNLTYVLLSLAGTGFFLTTFPAASSPV